MSYFALLEDLFGGLQAFSVARKSGCLNKIYAIFGSKMLVFTTKIFVPRFVSKYLILNPDSTKPGSGSGIRNGNWCDKASANDSETVKNIDPSVYSLICGAA
jgi:hypothetical protein